jgi:hypothetical protein
MLDCLVKFKEQYVSLGTKNKEFRLSSAVWDSVEEVHKSLKPARIATANMEGEQLSLGDIYKQWMIALKEIEAIGQIF